MAAKFNPMTAPNLSRENQSMQIESQMAESVFKGLVQ